MAGPFRPRRRGGSSPSLPGLVRVEPLTVTALTAKLRDVIEDSFPDVTVGGEISNFKRQSGSGHLYLTLKDADAQIDAVMFRNDAARLGFEPEGGMSVIARGRVSVYPARGRYQLIIGSLEPQGLGALHLAFEQLKEKLRAEGLFAEERKRPLPLLPRRIGVVTSPTGAAIRDILRVLERRFFALHVTLYPARVQGEGAAREVVEGIEALDRRGLDDVIIVGRGGGSLEDLWTFNEEVVARAIAASTTPVISAVGHEVDFTIADFVADMRAATPSAAAEMVVASKAELMSRVAGLGARARLAARARIKVRRERLERLATHRALERPRSLVALRRQRVDELALRALSHASRRVATGRSLAQRAAARIALLDPRRTLAARRTRAAALEQRLLRAPPIVLGARRQRLAALVRGLGHLSPLSVLERGYAIVHRPADGSVVRHAGEVAAGEHLRVRLVDGSVDVVDSRPAGPSAPRSTSRRRSPATDTSQRSLFGESSDGLSAENGGEDE